MEKFDPLDVEADWDNCEDVAEQVSAETCRAISRKLSSLNKYKEMNEAYSQLNEEYGLELGTDVKWLVIGEKQWKLLQMELEMGVVIEDEQHRVQL